MSGSNFGGQVRRLEHMSTATGDRIVSASMFMGAHLIAVVLFAASPSSPVKHFRLIEKSELPKTFLRYLCGSAQDANDRKDCTESFEKNGAVWAGDVNDDEVDEYIVDSGGMPGTLGPARSLVQRRGSD